MEVHERPAPAGKTPPYLTYSVEPEPYVHTIGGRISEAKLEVLVAAVGSGSPVGIRSLVEGARSVLHGQSGEREGYRVSAWEMAPFALPRYFLNGVPYFERGARYRLFLHRIAGA